MTDIPSKLSFALFSVRCDKARTTHTLLFATLASTVTSPLYVVALSMQMSIIPNLTIYGDVSPKDINKGLLTSRIGLANFVNRKAIATSEKQVAIYTKENMNNKLMAQATVKQELMVASGQVGLNKPFRAPIYRTYWECIRGLHKQGILGFYKGNTLRLMHLYFFQYISTQIHHDYLDGPDVIKSEPSYSKALFAGLIASGVLHLLHLSEARFVLQNRIPNF